MRLFHLKKYRAKKGFSTIELLIAFSVGIIFLTAAMMVSFSDPALSQQIYLESGQTAALDTTLDGTALATSSNALDSIVAKLSSNWNIVTNPDTDGFYTNTTETKDISPCLKEITNDTTWSTLGNRTRTMTFGTALGNIDIARGLGGDCDPLPPNETWIKPRVFSSHHFILGKPLSIDVLNRIAYVTDDKGTLQIYNSTSDTLGSNAGFSITPYVDSANKNLNDIDVFKASSRRYALVTRHDIINQFQIIDVTSPGSYTTSPTKTLAGAIPPTGSFPQGWRVFYYDNRAYVTTRETAGYEFHTFDLTTPLNPTEIGSGIEINGTVNDLTIISIVINNHHYKIAFLATDRSTNEVIVLNVTGSTPSLLTSIDLPTTNDALCIQLLGNRLYIGRQKTASGPELFVYNVTYGEMGSDPTVVLTPIGSGAEINSDVTQLRVTGKFAFIGNPLATTEFKVWDISHPATGFFRVDTNPLGISNKVSSIDYEGPYVYLISQTNDTFQILYSAP